MQPASDDRLRAEVRRPGWIHRRVQARKLPRNVWIGAHDQDRRRPRGRSRRGVADGGKRFGGQLFGDEITDRFEQVVNDGVAAELANLVDDHPRERLRIVAELDGVRTFLDSEPMRRVQLAHVGAVRGVPVRFGKLNREIRGVGNGRGQGRGRRPLRKPRHTNADVSGRLGHGRLSDHQRPRRGADDRAVADEPGFEHRQGDGHRS